MMMLMHTHRCHLKLDYTRGPELLSADILEDNSYVKKLYIMDGHGSVTALAENAQEAGTGGNSGTTEESYSQELTDTYVYDAYGNLLKQTGDTDNDYLYTGEQYNETTGLYYLRARYLSPETGTFVSMDSYAGTLDNPVSLHKYLYANANPVMYVDPSGNFSFMESAVAQGIKATINDLIAPGLTVKKVMTWANLVVTTYDIYQQMKLIFAGETNIVGLAWAIARGMVTQALLTCTATAILGKYAATVLKVVGIANDMQSFVEAVKSGDPERILIESLRLAVSVYTLKCQCFTEDTLVSTVDGDRPIGELEAGDKVWAYNTETGENEEKEITAVIVTETDVIVHVKTSDGEDIETTMFHPFYVRHTDQESGGSVYDGEWKAASNLFSSMIPK